MHQAAARASEQRASGLEAALERSGVAAAAMSEKVAQAMGDASGQVEALKVRGPQTRISWLVSHGRLQHGLQQALESCEQHGLGRNL